MNNSKQYLGKNVYVKIDRPLGSLHPKHSFVYEVNYGYIPNTVSGDNEELDAYSWALIHPCLNLREYALRKRLNIYGRKLLLILSKYSIMEIFMQRIFVINTTQNLLYRNNLRVIELFV